MPLVQGLQNKFGKDKLAVLLLSVDEEWGSHDDAVDGMKRVMAERSVQLPCAISPRGFEETKKTFGVDGYGIVLLDPDGTIKGAGLFLEEVEKSLGTP